MKPFSWLANGKQLLWWKREVGVDTEHWKRYCNDYKCALLEHGLYWSLVTFLPLFFMDLSDTTLALFVAVNALFHAWVDDLKANRFKINLIEDQILHFSQIAATVIVVCILK